MLTVGRCDKELAVRDHDKVLSVGRMHDKMLDVRVCDKMHVGREHDSEMLAAGIYCEELVMRVYNEVLAMGKMYDVVLEWAWWSMWREYLWMCREEFTVRVYDKVGAYCGEDQGGIDKG